MYFAYIIFSPAFNKFYIGESCDPVARLEEHNNQHYSDASTKFTNDWKVFFTIQCESRSQARLIEKHIKNMKSTKYLYNLKSYPEMVEKLLELYKQRTAPR